MGDHAKQTCDQYQRLCKEEDRTYNDQDFNEIDHQRTKLKRDIVDLESRALEVSQRLKLTRKKANSHLSQIGMIGCRPLCVYIIVKLPRELRDLVYEHLNKHDDVYIREATNPRNYWPYYSPRAGKSQTMLPPNYPHYWNPEYIGHDMKPELVESWFRTATSLRYRISSTAKTP